MIIGSISENLDIEQRVAITPDIIKKYKSLGLEVHLTKNYGPTKGCIALKKNDLLILLKIINKKSKIKIC